MARPRAFDRTEAVHLAMDAFWDLGFENASTAVLEERMGIGRSSFYAAFGSKESLYAEAMDAYIAALRERVVAPLREEGPAMGVLRAFFESVARRGSDGGCVRTCMIVRASVSGDRPACVQGRIDRVMHELDEAFHDLLVRARAEGSLALGRASLRAEARLLTTLFQGMNIAAGAGRPARELLGMARSMLAMLER